MLRNPILNRGAHVEPWPRVAGQDSLLMRRIRQVARMSSRELAVRLGQEASKRFDLVLCRMGVDLTPRTAIRQGSMPRFFFSAEDLPGITAFLQEAFEDETEAMVEYARRLLDHRFDLLGWRDVPCGKVIDWHADPVHGRRAPTRPWYRIPFLEFSVTGDHKVVWELNRHQHLITLAKAWHVTGDQAFAIEAFRQWRDWQDGNPYPLGVNWASSLEVAFRSLSWIWLDHLLETCPVRPSDFDDRLARALAISGRHIERYISTYFAPNTHLLGEGAALFFIGLLYPNLKPAARWRQRGWQTVLQEARAQVHPDGMHFEQAIYYHVYALDMLLHVRLLAARNDMAIPGDLDERIENMLAALCDLSQAGALPRFGDDDGGRLFDPGRNRPEHMGDPLATGAVLFRRSDFRAAAGGLREETVWLCGLSGAREFSGIRPEQAPAHPVALADSGIYAMACDGPPRQQLFIDAGPHGVMSGGHGHADALSVQLAIDGRMWFIDPGAFRYVCGDDARDRFRSTAAHNTLEVDGTGQADAVAPFRWRSLPSARLLHWTRGDNFGLFCGEHYGYLRLPSPVIHRRWVFGLDGGVWLIRDMALGDGVNALTSSWHLAPFLDVHAISDGLTRIDGGDHALLLFAPEQDAWARTIGQDEWSPAYGLKEPAPLLRFSGRASLPAETALLIVPASHVAASASGSLQRIDGPAGAGGDEGAVAYRYHSAHSDIWMIFRSGGTEWRVGEWASDALFLYAVVEDGEPRQVGFVDASYAEHAGRPITMRESAAGRHELATSNIRAAPG